MTVKKAILLAVLVNLPIWLAVLYVWMHRIVQTTIYFGAMAA